jgi:hypothetical protein
VTGLLTRSTLRLDALVGFEHALLRRADDEGPRSERGRQRLRREIRAAVDAFLASTQWSVRVPGTHGPSGLSNQELFAVRAEEGRDFLQRTVQLDQDTRPKMRALFSTWPRVPSVAELREAYSDMVVAYIADTRFEAGGGDILLTPLSAEYAKQKAADGYGGEPIGVATGEHRDALRERGRLEYSA